MLRINIQEICLNLQDWLSITFMTLLLSLSKDDFEGNPLRTSSKIILNSTSHFWRSFVVNSSYFTVLFRIFSEAMHSNQFAIVMLFKGQNIS